MSSVHGFWSWSGAHDGTACHASMASSLRMYGPSREYTYCDGNLRLGGNLSSFLPEDRYDRQPIATPDGLSWLVADVRLDNRQELTRALGLTAPERMADAAVLAAAWGRWGAACVDHLTGVFGFAVWTPSRQELYVVRDHTGERPMFFHRGQEFFAFASMPKGLLALPGVDRGLDEDTLVRALTLAAYRQDVSFFQGIERLPPGHLLRVTRETVSVSAYWRPFQAPGPRFQRDEEYVEAFLEIFDAAVAARLRTTGGVASQLSAGLDSSSVTASAARMLAVRGERLTSFTAVPRPGFGGMGAAGRLPDEGPGAQDVARLYPNIDHVLLDSSGQEMVSVVRTLSDAVDEPVQNGVNSLWMAATLDAAKARGCNVLLVGVRGNLTLSHTGLEALGAMLRSGHWLELARMAHTLRAHGFTSYRGSLARALAGVLPDGLARRLQGAGSFDLDYSPVNPAVASTQGLRERMLGEFFANTHDVQAERLELFQTYDFDTYAAGYQAVHGVDVRDPCADRRVVDFCFGLPIEQYLVGGVTRSLVRRAMRDRLPAATLTRTVRGQQGADWALVMQDAIPGLRDEMRLNADSAMARRLLDLPRMTHLLATMPVHGDGGLAAGQAWGDAVCRGFSFGYFMRRHGRS